MKTIVMSILRQISNRCACIAAARLRVERAERLVHQQDARLIGERAHDRHALLHAARQLMRIGVGEFLQADQLQPLQRLRSASYLLLPLTSRPNITFFFTVSQGNSV